MKVRIVLKVLKDIENYARYSQYNSLSICMNVSHGSYLRHWKWQFCSMFNMFLWRRFLCRICIHESFDPIGHRSSRSSIIRISFCEIRNRAKGKGCSHHRITRNYSLKILALLVPLYIFKKQIFIRY